MFGEELEKKKPKGDSVWTEDSGIPVPQEPEVAKPTRKPVKKAAGGMASASKRADGIAERGKTRGTMVDMCGGGMARGKR